MENFKIAFLDVLNLCGDRNFWNRLVLSNKLFSNTSPLKRSPCHEGSRHKGYSKIFESGIKFLYLYSEKSIKSNLTCPYRKKKVRKAVRGGGNLETKLLAPLGWVNDLHSELSSCLLS